jgi:hypothetical protein
METETSPDLQLDVQSIQKSSSGPYSVYHWFLFFVADDIRHSLSACFQVQRIKNQFTVTVYEIHARIALETVCSLQRC